MLWYTLLIFVRLSFFVVCLLGIATKKKMNTSTLPSTINKDKNASLPTCVKPPYSLRKKNYMSLSCFPQKILVIFRPKILFCSLSKHKFLRKRVTCFADIFLLSRVGLMTITWAAVLKRISYIFSFFLLLKFNTTTYSGKGNESNPFAGHATACGTCKH